MCCDAQCFCTVSKFLFTQLQLVQQLRTSCRQDLASCDDLGSTSQEDAAMFDKMYEVAMAGNDEGLVSGDLLGGLGLAAVKDYIKTSSGNPNSFDGFKKG